MKRFLHIHPLTLPVFIFFRFSPFMHQYFTLYLFIFLHELAHFFIALLLGLPHGKIHLFPWGCMLSLPSLPSKIKSLLIFLSGPVFNIIMALTGVFPKENISLAFFNLLPVPPLDGGIILNLLFPSGAFLTATVSIVILMLLCLYFKLSLIIPFILTLVLFSAEKHKIDKNINSRVISHFFVEKKAEKLYNTIDKV